MPRVSVIMVCHNGMRFLEEALESLVAQKFGDWEAIFWDNGSRDGSAELAGGFDPRIRVAGGGERIPLGAARAAAAAESRSELLAFLDVDDTWHEDRLQVQVDDLDEDAPALLFSDCEVVDADGRALGRLFERWPPEPAPDLDSLIDANFIPLPSVIVRRSAVEEAGGFDPELQVAADYDLWLRLLARGPARVSERCLARYRIHSSNLTRDFAAAYRENERIYRRLLADSVGDSARIRRSLAVLHAKWAFRDLWDSGAPKGALRHLRASLSASGGVMRWVANLAWGVRRAFRGATLAASMRRARARDVAKR